MRIAREEIFGPVLSVIAFDTEDEAVALANDSAYGLAGGVWTADPDHGLDVARRVRTGTFTVNGAPRDMRAPFGGFKASGLGREYGPVGLGAYTEYQSIGLPGPETLQAGAERHRPDARPGRAGSARNPEE